MCQCVIGPWTVPMHGQLALSVDDTVAVESALGLIPVVALEGE